MTQIVSPPSTGRLRLAALLASSACLLAVGSAARAEEAPAHSTATSSESSPNLAELSLEELMNIEVTSVSKRSEKAGEAAAAIYVITHDDIRRSGMTTLPDLLRLAPGLDVAQAHNGQWAVSIRGFNDSYSSKLLVLVNGRPVYSAAYAGVLWFMQDMPLEDIQRIEVIRGPGAAVWGANAVNGVINIITLPSADTQGGLVSLSGGGQSRDQATVRFGGRLSEDAAYRVYVRGVNDRSLRTPTGADGGDPSSQVETGFRLDWTPSDRDRVTAGGQYLSERTRVEIPAFSSIPPILAIEHDAAWYLQFAWEHALPQGSLSTQAYIQHDRIGQLGGVLRMTTVEGEARYRFAWGDRQDVIVGAGYRQRDFSTVDGPFTSITATAPAIILRQLSLFGQDAISLSRTLTLTAGAKAEHTTETGWEFEPSIRLAWTPSPGHTGWAAVSRAVRSPSIGERGIMVLTLPPGPPTTPPTFIVNFGNPDQKSETEVSIEAGYRAALSRYFSVDLTAFDNHYGRLATNTFGAPVFEPTPLPAVLIPAVFGNLAKGRTRGAEVSATWQVSDAWRLSGSYSALSMHAKTAAADAVIGVTNDPGKAPRGQYQLHSRLDLPHRTEFDAALFHVGRLRTGPIPAYTRLDLRLGWRPTDRLELALVGQNLLDDHHPEIGPNIFRVPEEVPRTVFIQLRAGF